MKFVCERCQTRYSIADEKVRQRILRIRCKTCSNVITVQAGEVVSGPQYSSWRSEPAARASSSSALAPSSKPSRPTSGLHEWFVAVDGVEQGPLSCTDAAKVIVSLKPEQSVHVWKAGMDGWKQPKDVALIAQEISALKRSPATASSQVPVAAVRAESPSARRPAPLPADSASGARAPGSRPKLPLAGGSGSGPKLPQPGSGSKLSRPIPGSGPKVAPPPIPGSGSKAAPRPIPGSGPKVAPPPIPGSGPKGPPPVPGPGPKLAPAAGSWSVVPSQKKGPALPGLTPLKVGHPAPALETEFDRAPTTEPEKRPSGAREVAALGRPDSARPTGRHERFADNEFDEGQTTPPPRQALPPVASPARDGHGGESRPSSSLAFAHPPALPQLPGSLAAPAALTLPAAPAPLPGSLFGSLSALPVLPLPVAHAEAGLSKLTGLAALVHRHRHLKYVVAASIVVVLVILVILLSWRGESGKPAGSASERAARAPEIPALVEAETPAQDENAGGPGGGPKERSAPRNGPKRSAVVRSAGPSRKAAAVAEDPFERPTVPSHSAERPAPVETPSQSRRSGPSPSGGQVKQVSQSQLGEIVRSKENQAGIKSCYERALKRDGRLRTGRLDITVSVGATGVVQNVQVHGPSDFLIIEGCIKNAIRHWRFPASTEEYATSFPYILQGG